MTVIVCQNSSSSTSTPPANTGNIVTSDYPVNVQTNYLNACEQRASASACGCTLNWFEQNITLAQFEQDEASLEATGQEPADLQSAVSACTG